MNLDSVLKIIRGCVKLVGSTDNSKIGNDGDRLRVINQFNASDNVGYPSISNKLRYDLSTTGLVLTGSYQTIYSYIGSGKLLSFIIDMTNNKGKIKLTLDSTELIFDLSTLDVENVQSASTRKGPGPGGLGWDNTGSKLVWSPDFSLAFESQVLIEGIENTGAVSTEGYIVVLTKES